ncbi:potassium-transporting ATPase subunit C [Streptomyces glomeratus]|uniref:potassium-transporting ATPase subunit C n=1 Tax=Streptomyces glomeratus TaxID=284452 RepID=UPI0031E4809E
MDPSEVPVPAVASSGSGLDADISPAYAYEHADRVANARGLAPAVVRTLVVDHISGRRWLLLRFQSPPLRTGPAVRVGIGRISARRTPDPSALPHARAA